MTAFVIQSEQMHKAFSETFWVVVQVDRVSRLKLYACFAADRPYRLSKFISAWTARPEDADRFTREGAVHEMRIRQQNGHHLQSWILHVEEVL